ncbi:TPA: anaerobic ribonucleoside-triphosphate reductase activating protein [Vibrio vulnificus]|uniref:Anaerobic ribonucleoside-triphosphate reductase-activating protein n=1 Tax=Vibrio vulnificus TaxID=672 RepID=A0A8H9MVH4_VIBVL|nr:anaerobic ribonucleoside-triphosphate reductase activating protein [Vibrio vulnificus]HAS8538407.1 anaerobic ribonucleoside-triphosphate reductase activating protein [Vibrio vulnificus]
MNYIKIDKFDTNNGTGVRMTLFVSGCPHACKGCFNSDFWNYKSGLPWTDLLLDSLLVDFERNQNHLAGLSILGGEPLAKRNLDEVMNVIQRFKSRFPNKTVWLWSGYTLEEIKSNHASGILECIDVLVDGKYIESMRDTSLQYRGSSNQRVLYKHTNF